MPQIDWQTALAEHDRWLRTVVLARVGHASVVDEVMQEVALAAVAQRSAVVSPASVGPWLYRVALVQSILYRRKQGRLRKLTARYRDRVPPSEHDARQADPLEWLLADEQQSLLRRAIARLPRRDVELLLLKYTENWTYEQLAQHLGTTPSAIESRLHRARAKLRSQLAACEPLEVEP